MMTAGEKIIDLDVSGLATGNYVYNVKVPNLVGTFTQSQMLLKNQEVKMVRAVDAEAGCASSQPLFCWSCPTSSLDQLPGRADKQRLNAALRTLSFVSEHWSARGGKPPNGL